LLAVIMMQQTPSGKPAEKKKFLGIHFRCCNVYSRVYVNDAGTAYEGRCPRCHKKVNVAIGQGGVSSRFFEAY
jgi:hypothetical protein